MTCSKPHSTKRDFFYTSIFISLLTILLLMASVSAAQALGKAYVTDIFGIGVDVVDLSTNSVIKTIDIYTPSSACTSETPYIHDIEVIGSKVFVSVPGASGSQCEINQIAVIDSSTDTVVNTIDTDRAPTGLREYNGKLYVVNQASNTIHEIDPNTETILRTIPFPNLSSSQIHNPIGLEIVDDKIYLPYAGSGGGNPGGVGIIELATGNPIIFRSFGGVDSQGPLSIKQVADHKIYLGGIRHVAVFDTTTDQIVNAVQVKNETAGMIAGFAIVSNKVYTANQESSVSVLNLSSDTFITQIDLAIHPSGAHPIVDIAAFNGKVYATDPVDSEDVPQGVHIIDSSTDTVIGKVSTEIPFGAIDILEVYVPLIPEKAYVSNVQGSKVSIIDLVNNSVIKTIDIFTPSGSCASNAPHINDIKIIGTKVFVTVPGASNTQCEINQIKVIDSTTDALVNTIDTDRVPSGLKEYDGKLYVVNRNDSSIHEIDPTTETILRTIPYTNPNPSYMNNPVYLEIVNGKIYLPFPGSGGTAGGVQVLDLATGNQSAFIDFGSVDNYGPRGIKEVANNKIYLGGRFDVAVLNTTTDTIVKTISVKEEGAGYVLNFAVASNKVYTANSESTVSVIDLATDTFITKIDVDVHAFAAHPHVDIVGKGNRVYVTDASDISDTPQGVKIIDTTTDTVIDTVSTTEFFGAIEVIQPVIPPPTSRKAYISNLLGSNVSVVDLNTNNVIHTIDIYTPSGSCSSETPHINDIKVLGSKVFITVPGAANQQCEISKIKVIDPASDTIVNTIDTDLAPAALKEYKGKLYVLNRYGNSIQEIDPETESIVRRIPFSNPFPYPGGPLNPKDFEIVNDKIYLPFPGTGTFPGGVVSVLDLSTGSSIRFINFGAINNYLGPTGIKQVAENKIYLGGRTVVAVVNPNTNSIVNVFQVKGEMAGDVLGFAVVNNRVYTANSESTVSVINLNTDGFLGQIDIGVHPNDAHPFVDMVVLGDYVYVTDPMDGNSDPQGVKIIDSKTDTLVENIPTEELFGAIGLFTISLPVLDVDPLPDIDANYPVILTTLPTATDFYGNTITATTNDPLTYTAPGTYTVEWIFEDAYGNIITQTQKITIEDNTPPTLTCPDDITVVATDTLTEIDYEATAVDSLDPNVVITYDPVPGSLFQIGTTTVTVTATDSSNYSSECTFTVNVLPPGPIEPCFFRAAITARGQGEEHGLSGAISVSQIYIGIDANAVTYKAASPPPNSTAYLTLSGYLNEDIRKTDSSSEEWTFTVAVGDYADPNLDGYYPVLSWDPNEFCFQSTDRKFQLYSLDEEDGLTLLVDDMLQTNQYQTKEEESKCIPDVGCWLRYSIIWSSGFVFEMNLEKGWSLISLPFNKENSPASDLFPEAEVIYGFQKELGYVRVKENETLNVGEGYWILMPEERSYSLTGAPINEYTLSVQDGWSLIGSCSSPARPSINTGHIDVIYGFNRNVGYVRVKEDDTLNVGEGFWILLSNTEEGSELQVKTTGLRSRKKSSDPNDISEEAWQLVLIATGQDLEGANNISTVTVGMDQNASTYQAPTSEPPNYTAYMKLEGTPQDFLEDIRAIGSNQEVWFLTLMIGSYANYGSDGYYPELSWNPNMIGPAQGMELRRGHDQAGLILVNNMAATNTYQTEEADGTYISYADIAVLEYTIIFESSVYTTYYHDSDGDSFGDPNDSIVALSQPQDYVINNDDCDDTDAQINPNTIWYEDTDGNGYGDANEYKVQCEQPNGYVLQAKVATPVISPSSGYFTGSINVSMSSETTDAKIYFTTNGSNPTKDSTLYTGPFVLTYSATIKAKAYKDDIIPSNIESETYTRQDSGYLGGSGAYPGAYPGGYPGVYGYSGGFPMGYSGFGIPGGYLSGYQSPYPGGFPGQSYGGLMGGLSGFGAPYLGGSFGSPYSSFGFGSPYLGSGFGSSFGLPSLLGGLGSPYFGTGYMFPTLGSGFGSPLGFGGLSGLSPFTFSSFTPNYGFSGFSGTRGFLF